MSDFTVVSIPGESITVLSQPAEQQVTVPTGGLQGAQGEPGKSAYELAVEQGFIGTEAQWIASLAGTPGAAGPKGDTGDQGPQGNAGPSGDPGADGIDGASAYEIALANGYVGTQSQWLASLIGATGPAGAPGAPGAAGADGADGASAYQIAVANGFVGTESAWLASLEGAQGPAGAPASEAAPVFVRVQQTSGQSYSSGANTVVAYQSAVEDTDSMWDAANNRIVIGAAAHGKVAVLTVQHQDSADGTTASELYIERSQNSGSTWSRVAQSASGGIDHFGIFHATAVLRVANGEMFRVRRFAGEAKTSIGDSRCSFTFCTLYATYGASANTVNTQTGTAYTLATADRIVEMNNASANAVTVPAEASVNIEVGVPISITQLGAGATKVKGAPGVYINGISEGEVTLSGQFAAVSLYKRSSNFWIVQGNYGGTAGGSGGDATSIGGNPVSTSSTASGDVLRFNGSAWANYPEQNIVDGGNF